MATSLPTRYSIDITPKSFLVVALGSIILFALWLLRDFILLIVLAVIIASFVNAGAKVLKRVRIPRTVGVITMYLFFVGLLVLFAFVFVPLLLKEIVEFIDYIPKNTPWGDLIHRISKTGLTEKTFTNLLSGSSGFQEFWKLYFTDSVVSGINAVVSTTMSVFLVFIISFFLSIREGGLHGFLRMITPVQHEPYIIDLWNRVEEKIGYWFGGQFILAFVTATIAFIGFSIIGMPYALLLSLFILILEFVPFGLTVGTITITPIAFISGGLGLGIPVLIFLGVLNVIEANILQPLIVQKTVGVPMLLVIISVIAWMQLIGWTGAIVAIPFSVLMLEIIYDREKAALAKLRVPATKSS